MKRQRKMGSLLVTLLLGCLAGLPAVAADRWDGDQGGAAAVDALGDWVVTSGNNVCGVTDARQISNPAKVRYKELLDATPSMKEMKRKGLKPESPEGQILHNKAVDSVRRAAETVRSNKGYCSVWKKIRHKKGTSVPDITAEVKQLL